MPLATAPVVSRPIEYGFLPSGSLEDVTDYWYWLVTSVCTVWGFESLETRWPSSATRSVKRLQAEGRRLSSGCDAGARRSTSGRRLCG